MMTALPTMLQKTLLILVLSVFLSYGQTLKAFLAIFRPHILNLGAPLPVVVAF